MSTSLTQEPTRPQATEPPRPGPRLSPYYRRYLLDQADAIRAHGGDDEAVRQFVQLDLKAPLSARVTTPVEAVAGVDTPDNLRGVSMALLQGTTFGFGDEAIGALYGALSGIGARKGIEQYRAEYEAWAKEHHAISLAAEIAGGIPVGFGGVAKAGILAGMGRGALFGAIAGAGAADNTDLTPDMLGDRFKSAIVGALGGAAFGGAIPLAGAFAKPIARPLGTKIAESVAFGKVAKALENVPVLQRLNDVTPEGRARETVLQWVLKQGATPEEAVSRLWQRSQGFLAQGQRPTILDIMGDDFMPFANEVLQTRTPAAKEALELLTQRESASGEQLLNQLFARVLNVPKLGIANVYAAEDRLHATALRAAKPHYEDAHAQVVQTTPAMRDLFKRKEFRDAWNQAADVANGELEVGRAKGLAVPKLPGAKEVAARDAQRNALLDAGVPRAKVDATIPELGLPDELPVRGIDYMKRYLQEPVLKRFKQTELTPQRRTIRDNELAVLEARYNSILGETIQQVPSFGKALSLYSGPMASRDAVSRGYERFVSKDSWYDVRKDLAKLSPVDRDFYRMGAVRALYDRMLHETDPHTDIATKLFGGAMTRVDDAGQVAGRLNNDALRIKALFGDNKQAAQDFLRVVVGQARLAKTTGSTLRLPAKVNAQEGVDAVIENLPPIRANVGLTLYTAGRQALRSEQVKRSTAENNALAELFGKGLRDPHELEVLLDDFSYAAKRRPYFLTARIQRALAAQSGKAGANLF